ncbi:tRNA (guanosine(37)-N1)-methyltransferase TrmD [Microlunatus soli]|uniref:tRNA (guanine-N(1)-)-methyltransferase n=1 Tax=Microlunatus soli TaxID=630515 RepID=A0A1H1NIN2_9ACTN|nr:tRNA (guanosine(37)-N1)-methyltransferase TrmD [Microlunatus soli]SDR98743.1 tRNA (Guanine37-N(1)-) methyltransferase [Microlunatus soli]
MKIDVVSIFPEYLQPLNLSLVGKAIENGIVDLGVHDLRQWTHDRHRTVDDTPYGGGAGMVMKPEPWGEALDDLAPVGADPDDSTAASGSRPRLLIMTPAGRPFTQRIADELADADHLIVACGRYEGIDARVAEDAATRMQVDEISIGDYVLNGGEAAALVIIEAVVRLLPGVIGNPESLAEESHAAGQDGLLEYPLYTKPQSWRGLDVPDILFSGHHAKIAGWRREQAEALTRRRRPDLLPEISDPPSGPGALHIERASAEDAGEIVTVQRAAFVSEALANKTLALPAFTQTVDEVRTSLADAVVLVARQGSSAVHRGRVIGSVLGRLTDDDAWYIGRLVVAPDRQGEGIGGRLLRAIEEAAPAECRTIRLVTGSEGPNSSFYSRHGYRVISHEPHDGSEIVNMEKALDSVGS